MVITFVSNYINHHQIPFCDAMSSLFEDVDFHFVQAMPMEEKRINMGWAVDPKDYPYVSLFYEDEKYCEELILNSDVVIFGWTEGITSELEKKRLSSGRLSFRVSERIYRGSRIKWLSPRGLMKKYNEHIRYRKKPVYLLCAGAYVSADFKLIHAYPDKMLKWGYYPDVKDRSFRVSETDNKIRLCWAGRFVKLKHPEYAIELCKELEKFGYDYELKMIGDGYMREELEKSVSDAGLSANVSFLGNLKPEEVTMHMKDSDIFLFTSNYLEGWGAVVNEAMQCGCAVVASREAGAVPFLITDGENGFSYRNGDCEDFKKKVLSLFQEKYKILQFAKNGYDTIEKVWNAKNASMEFVRFCREYIDGAVPRPADIGPMSKAEIIKPESILRAMTEGNCLE
ncbi:Glycosyltransferase involved in cell wall bisynthesis [Butyrivibrio hungatei]|uniref:Glycosyltransferase involved in cell wall bisynthesis n=1 Tax=Butyrivibrio hungatei TaxID=185008 RepID=A0A1G5CDM7_9FIRM|nr:glycosyltransferase [Butyrivibrio hungatei]SCY00441.1 Glycosyltransferase involved in cell wall bisynthesis [Butyrivibrio hungatei]